MLKRRALPGSYIITQSTNLNETLTFNIKNVMKIKQYHFLFLPHSLLHTQYHPYVIYEFIINGSCVPILQWNSGQASNENQ